MLFRGRQDEQEEVPAASSPEQLPSLPALSPVRRVPRVDLPVRDPTGERPFQLPAGIEEAYRLSKITPELGPPISVYSLRQSALPPNLSMKNSMVSMPPTR